jgi:hypothetical protein
MEFLTWLEGTAIANAIKTSIWMYPALETSHYIGLAFLVGGIMLIDLRVLGVGKRLPLNSMIGLLPWVWAGFAINLTSGTLIFIYGATNFGVNPSFWVKMTLMALAGLNALIFDLAARRSSGQWEATGQIPVLVKSIATLSFVLWLCVVTTGRWMAYI